jgi:hypothetical protein
MSASELVALSYQLELDRRHERSTFSFAGLKRPLRHASYGVPV